MYRSSDLERCDTLGVHAVLTKPIGQRDLLQAIGSALSQKKGLLAPVLVAAPATLARLLGEEFWRQRCEELYRVLTRIESELQQLPAA